MDAIIRSDIFRYAFIGGTVTAGLSGLVGYFLAIRSQAFASEAFTDIGFAGASGAALVGVSPLLGMALFALGAAAGIGTLSERARGRDVETGMVLSFAIGIGVLFLTIYSHSSARHSLSGVNILFGSLLTLQPDDVILVAALSIVVLVAVLILFRPLLFATLDPEVAAARGVRTRVVSVAFLFVLAVAVAASARLVGVLLVPSLMIAPAAAAVNLFRRPWVAILVSVGFAEAVMWGGLLLGLSSVGGGLPVGFYIATFASAIYFASVLSRWVRQHHAPSARR